MFCGSQVESYDARREDFAALETDVYFISADPPELSAQFRRAHSVGPQIKLLCDETRVTGKYFDQHGRETSSSPASRNEVDQERLWEISESMISSREPDPPEP